MSNLEGEVAIEYRHRQVCIVYNIILYTSGCGRPGLSYVTRARAIYSDIHANRDRYSREKPLANNIITILVFVAL